MIPWPLFEDPDKCSHSNSAKVFFEGFSAGLIVVCKRCGTYGPCRPYKGPAPKPKEGEEPEPDEPEDECDCATPVIGAIAWTCFAWVVLGLIILMATVI